MYSTHFELDGPLFRPGIAQDDAVLVGDPSAHDALTLHARIALSTPDSALVLLGPSGVGKTTQAAAALRAAAGSMRTSVAWLRTPPTTPHELLESLLAELGFEAYKQSRAERLQAWRQHLVELAATETRVFVAVERAHEADPAVLQALDALTAPDANGCAGANLILMGPDELREKLEADVLVGLRQRVRLVRRIEPLDGHGVEIYLRAAVSAAGGEFDRVFATDAAARLAALSNGIPRVLNHLADSALALAAARAEPTVTAALIDEVAADVYGLTSSAMPETVAEADTQADAPAAALMPSESASAPAFAPPEQAERAPESAISPEADTAPETSHAADAASETGIIRGTDSVPKAAVAAEPTRSPKDALFPEYALAPKPALAPEPELSPKPEPSPEPELSQEPEPSPERANARVDAKPVTTPAPTKSTTTASATTRNEPAAHRERDAESEQDDHAETLTNPENIPVLTDSVDGEPVEPDDDLDILDPAATLSLLGEDLDALVDQISDEMLTPEESEEMFAREHSVADAAAAQTGR